MGSSLIADSAKRRKIFDRRAESVLKQARELSVLCDVPACVVIYNPDDAIKPWRIWPDSEAELRNVIEFYKGKVGSGSTSSTVANNGSNGVADEWKQIDLDGKIESRIMEYANNFKNQSHIDQETPHRPAAAVGQADNNMIMMMANTDENYSKLNVVDGDGVTFDGWDDENNDLFDIHELLNFSDCDDDDFDPTLLFQKETESAATAPAVGIKRKQAAPLRVSSFEELMIPSSQRRKLNLN